MIAKGQMLGYNQGPVNVVNVRNVAAAMIRAAELGKIGERYLVGNWNTTQKELNQLIAKVGGVASPIFPLPFTLTKIGFQCE